MLLLDKWTAQAMADRQALIGLGEREDLPTFAAATARFDAALVADSHEDKHAHLDPDQVALRRALGVL